MRLSEERLHEGSAAVLSHLLVTSAIVGAVLGTGATDVVSTQWGEPERLQAKDVGQVDGLDRTLALTGNWSRVDGRAGSPAIRFSSTSVGVAADHRSLDPGRRSFAVSVAFRIRSGTGAFDGTDSPNVVQKGSYDSRGQWKIQLIPDEGGRVQCRMKGSRTDVMLTSSVTHIAADRGWHRASCVRRSQAVLLIVDGVTTARRVAIGRVSSNSPMTVANKASRPRSDQFRGVIDAVATAKGDRPLQRTLRATRR